MPNNKVAILNDGIDAGPTGSTREKRSSRMFVVTVRGERSGEQSIIVRNISSHGIGARARSHVLEIGERVTIMIDGEALSGEVRWIRKDLFGVQLSHEIDPSRFTFAHKSWESATRPFGPNHVYDQFRPVSNIRRPGLKVR